MKATTFLAGALAAVSGLAAPQSGGQFYAVLQLYRGGGCTNSIYPYAVFGQPNICQPFPSDVIVTSVNTTFVTQQVPGCSVHVFTDLACTQGETLGVLDHCEQASTPFKAVNVECPNWPPHK